MENNRPIGRLSFPDLNKPQEAPEQMVYKTVIRIHKSELIPQAKIAHRAKMIRKRNARKTAETPVDEAQRMRPDGSTFKSGN